MQLSSQARKAVAAGLAASTLLWSAVITAPQFASAAVHSDGCLVLSGGIVWMITGGTRRGFTSAEVFMSHGYNFSQVVTATAEDAALPVGPIMTYADGTLVKGPNDPLVYLVANGQKRPFVSGSVFLGLGYSFANIQQAPVNTFSDLPTGSNLDSTTIAHPAGTLVISNGAVWKMTATGRMGFPSAAVFNSYGMGFNKVVAANSYDLAMPDQGAVSMRTPCTGGNVTPPPPVTGSATVSLAGDTPAAATIPDAANANFTKFTLTAGSSGATISSIYVTRYGLSVNSDVENIKILDSNMVQVSSSGTLNSNNKAQLTFSPALNIPANTIQSFYIRAGIVDGTTGGKTVIMGIDSAADIVGNSTFSGSFPVKGNTFTTVLLTIGTVTLDEDGTVTDSQPDVGDTDVILNKFSLAAGTTESVTVQQIAVERQGSAGAADSNNIELYDASKSQTIATVSSWDANDLVTFNNLNITLNKGETRRFQIRADIAGGSGLTVNADLTDGSDARVQALGGTYGYYITPTNSMSNGQGASNQTIQSGSLTITKSAATPATGNIAPGSDVKLAVFDFQVLGEPVKITSVNVDMDLTTMVYTEVTNVKMVNNSTGALLGGPQDLSSGSEVTFTDVIILPVGTTQVAITANIANSVSANDSLNVDIDDASTGIVAKGVNSNDSLTPSPSSAVSSNELTVQAATLSATTNATPAARSVVVGQQDFVWATFTLSAANSGEDVNVTALTIEDTVNESGGGDSGAQEIDNAEIWADLTSGTSSRGDAYETLVGTAQQFTGTGDADSTLSYNLNPVVTVPKNSSITFAVVADLASTADVSDTHSISLDTDAGDVTASGKTTGTSISNITPSGAGQAMTVATGGTLTVTVDTSSPQSAGVLLDTSTEQTTAVFRLAANNTEDLNVDNITITDDGTNGNDVVAAYKFYNGSTLLGSVVPDGSGNATVYLGSGQLVIPANNYKLVTVKVVLNDIDGTGFVNGDTLITTIAAAGDVDTTGLASGAAVDSTDTSVDGQTFTAYEAYPSISFASDASIGTAVTQSSNQLIAKLAVTNPGNKDVTFQSGDSDLLSVQLSVVGDDTDTANETVTLKDQDGTTLDTATFSSATTTAQLDFDMSSVGATVGTTFPAGQTKYLYIYADTSDLEDAGNVIQVWLDDTDADVTFGINGTGAYTEGSVIFKGDIFGPILTNQS